MDIKEYFRLVGYETFPMGHNQIVIRKQNIHMSVEIMVDNNWFGTQYPLRDLIVYKNRLQTRSDWLCVMNRDTTEFYIIPMCVVLSALQVSRESNKTTKEIMYIVDTSLAQYSYKEGSLYF